MELLLHTPGSVRGAGIGCQEEPRLCLPEPAACPGAIEEGDGGCFAAPAHGSPGVSALPVLCWMEAEDSETVSVVLALDLLLTERRDEMEQEQEPPRAQEKCPFPLGDANVCVWGKGGGTDGAQGRSGSPAGGGV